MHIKLALLYHAFLIISSCKKFETKLGGVVKTIF